MVKPLAVAVAFFSLLFAAGAAQTLNGPALIRVTQRAVETRDLTAQTTRTAYIRDRKGRRIGWSLFLCTELEGRLLGRAAYCAVTFSFPRGRIQALGVRRNQVSYTLAVVGGTGYYSNALGTVWVRRVDASDDLLLFSLET